MMTPNELARLERLELLVGLLQNSSGIEPLIGDVNGPSNANALTQIAALAGGGNQLVGVDNAGFITVGVVPPPGPQAMGGDVTGTTAASVISKIQALAGGGVRFVAVDNAGNVGTAVPPAPPANYPMGGDVTGTTSASTVVKINGASVPVSGALTTGNLLQVTGAAALGYAALNLAGGANFVTGVLPEANQADQTMGGDVTGSTSAATVVKVNGATVPAAGALTPGNSLLVTGAGALGYGAVNLAGGAASVTGVLPEANQADQTMAGDVTGSTGASVLSKIAALGGSGTVAVNVDNAGNVISGGAPATADPFAFLSTTTDNLVASSAVKNYDFDLSGAAFTNKLIRMRARGYATTKDTGGVAGANLTGSAHVQTDAVYENKNGTVTFVSAAAGGAANPMPAVNNEMTLQPQACDAALQSGGGAPPNLAWTVTGGTTARLQLTATNNVNRGSWEIDVYQRVKAAP